MELWSFILNHLANNRRVILIVVIDAKGSSPGRPGFKMAVAGDGTIAGSIGGGIMEYNMVELARKKISEGVGNVFVKHQVHSAQAEHDRSGMICAGEQTQIFVPLFEKDIDSLTEITGCIDKGEKGFLTITSRGLAFKKTDAPFEALESHFTDENDWEFKETLGLKDTFYIFGAGHISLPLSRILRMLDFRVVVFDDRKELSTFDSNSFAHQKQLVDYENIGHLVPEGETSYVAIMSFGHRSDDIILRQLLSKRLKYLGMIGSKSKVNAIYDSLRKYGFTDADFERVDSPIGIPVGSQTPAEIAVSIAAKIIGVKNGKG